MKSLINNNLKRKLKRSTNENRMLNIIVIFENIVLNHLIKELKLNELNLSLVTSMLSSLKDLTNEISVLQTLQRIQKHYKKEF